MKTPDNNNGAAQGTATAAKSNTAKNIQTVNRPAIPGNEKNNEPAKTEPAANAAEAAPAPKAEVKTNATEHTAPASEPAKPEVKEEPKAGLNLEQTVKAVEGLHRKNIQRLALIGRIKTLEDFEVKLAESNDQLESNVYHGCKLVIQDDKGNQFTTNTPNLIQMVSQFLYNACLDKLSEIESEIVFPAA